MESKTAGSAHSSQYDWSGIARSRDFQELTRKRRSYVIPASIVFVVWYFGFIILAGYASDFMGERIWEGLTVGYLFALSQFLMVWVLAGLYLRRSNRVLDPIRERIVRDAAAGSSRGRRFRRGDVAGDGDGDGAGNGGAGNGGATR